jgi:uncharacterized membrane protein
MLQLFLVLHVLGAIFVFGPSVAFTFLASEARRMPQGGHFAAVVGNAIERKVVLPGAVVQGITGVGLILIGGFDLTQQANRWLLGGIILYAIAIVFAFAVQARNAEQMVELTKMPLPAAAPAAAAPSGPPPEIAATGQRLARGGMFLTGMIVLIVVLMVTKPGV